jgi:hypothetical protein
LLLDALGVPIDVIESEGSHAESFVFTRTIDRRILWSMNEVCFMLSYGDEAGDLRRMADLFEQEKSLAHFVHMKLPETFPDRAVRGRLGGLDPKVH